MCAQAICLLRGALARMAPSLMWPLPPQARYGRRLVRMGRCFCGAKRRTQCFVFCWGTWAVCSVWLLTHVARCSPARVTMARCGFGTSIPAMWPLCCTSVGTPVLCSMWLSAEMGRFSLRPVRTERRGFGTLKAQPRDASSPPNRRSLRWRLAHATTCWLLLVGTATSACGMSNPARRWLCSRGIVTGWWGWHLTRRGRGLLLPVGTAWCVCGREVSPLRARR